MQVNPFLTKKYPDSITINPFCFKKTVQFECSIKKITSCEFDKRKNTFKLIDQNKIQEQKNQINFDFINQKDSKLNDEEQHPFHMIKTSEANPTTKGVRFRERVSIQNRNSIEIRKQNMLIDISNQQKISMLHDIANNKNFNISMTSRRRAPENVKIVSDLMNSPVQSRSSIIQELKCLMCHYPQQNSILFGKKVICGVKEKLQEISNINADQGTFFCYQAFGYFLRTLNDLNYDSHEVIAAFQKVLIKYTYPMVIKLMLYYFGSFLYQLNNLYDRSEEILGKMSDELLKLKLFEYVGVYLILMVKLKSNLLEWDLCSKYLMKLLAYSWVHKFDNLEVWVYFELSRSFFFLNRHQDSEYFKTRSQMSILEPKTNIYRQLIAKDFMHELIYMRDQHKPFNLEKIISTCELIKIQSEPNFEFKERVDFKLQSQIKNINEHCKIRHVKNLLSRINSSQQIKKNAAKQFTYSGFHSVRHFAGNPLLRTHESGLKNLKIYFRNNPKGQTLLNKNCQPRLYTFQNSQKNMLVLKELCRNILLEMKWFVAINIHQS